MTTLVYNDSRSASFPRAGDDPDEKLIRRRDRSRTIEERCDVTEARGFENAAAMKHCFIEMGSGDMREERRRAIPRYKWSMSPLATWHIIVPCELTNVPTINVNRCSIGRRMRLLTIQQPLITRGSDDGTILSGDSDLNFLKAIELAARPYDRELEKEATHAGAQRDRGSPTLRGEDLEIEEKQIAEIAADYIETYNIDLDQGWDPQEGCTIQVTRKVERL
ncbi:hypothetical protein Scep_007860 [Stephania cephalantha]|uniref:Uncharacterized protein n=1 Tax=Stephania cephalantha TaxID=152367 RepID=A0AAP0KCF4_9MAGN